MFENTQYKKLGKNKIIKYKTLVLLYTLLNNMISTIPRMLQFMKKEEHNICITLKFTTNLQCHDNFHEFHWQLWHWSLPWFPGIPLAAMTITSRISRNSKSYIRGRILLRSSFYPCNIVVRYTSYMYNGQLFCTCKHFPAI